MKDERQQQETQQAPVIRLIALGGMVLVLFVILFAAAANIQLLKGEQYSQSSESVRTRVLTLKGGRGAIYDRNGLPLAYDVPHYDVEFYRDPARKSKKDYQEYTRILNIMADIIEANDEFVIDTLSIKKDEAGAFVFDFGNVAQDIFDKRLAGWISNMFIPQTYTKEGAEASTRLYAKEGDTIVNVRPAEEFYQFLMSRYQISEETPYDRQRKLLSVWQEVTMSSYTAYIPIKIATNVSFETMAQISANGFELQGSGIAQTAHRYYPRGSSLAPVIGYTGRISDEPRFAKYTDPNGDYRYSVNDLVGQTGIEASMEYELSGNLYTRAGKRMIEVNSLGAVKRVVSNVEPQNGNDVYLTIDADLQRVVETALAQNIAATREYQIKRYNEEKKEEFDEIVAERKKEINYAKMGAAVVLDARNGEVLAMANYPSYDANLFVGRISEADYDLLQNDPGLPMFNKAVASRAHPGSIFKMVTGYAALCEGVTQLDERVSDMGYYETHLKADSLEHGPRCWLHYGLEMHANQTIVEALKNSCNYYFYEMAYRLKITNLYDWGAKLGLDELTGVELQDEVKSQVARQETLYDINVPASKQRSLDAQAVYRNITTYLQELFEGMDVDLDPILLDEVVSAMMNATVATEGNQGVFVRNALINDLKLPRANMVGLGVDTYINQQLYQLLWTATRTLVTGIGQDSMITPIAAARYVAAVANGGRVYETHLIKRVVTPQGRMDEKKATLVRDLEIPADIQSAIKEGMRAVVSGEDGTATELFKDFEYLYDMAGKTGTAQVSKIDIEQNAWFVAFAPFESPEIAIAVYIPQGSSGARNATTVKAIIKYWLDKRSSDPEEELPAINAFTP